MLINTLRGLMAEFGIVVAEGPRHVGELVAILANPADQRIPAPLHHGLLAIVETFRGLERRIETSRSNSSLGPRQPDLPAPDHHPRLRTDPVQCHGSDRR